jgi:hypothetical protein
MTKLIKTASLLFTVIIFGFGCYHFGYVHGYVDALQWAKGVNFDQ